MVTPVEPGVRRGRRGANGGDLHCGVPHESALQTARFGDSVTYLHDDRADHRDDGESAETAWTSRPARSTCPSRAARPRCPRPAPGFAWAAWTSGPVLPHTARSCRRPIGLIAPCGRVCGGKGATPCRVRSPPLATVPPSRPPRCWGKVRRRPGHREPRRCELDRRDPAGGHHHLSGP
jgi:hypothetical protein